MPRPTLDRLPLLERLRLLVVHAVPLGPEQRVLLAVLGPQPPRRIPAPALREPRVDPCGGLTRFGAEPLVRHLGALVRGGALQLEGAWATRARTCSFPRDPPGRRPLLGPRSLPNVYSILR
jgi:hypothetical protein